MIICLLILVAILFFISWNYNVDKKAFHAIFSCITTILLVGGIWLSIANFHDYYGMHHSTTTSTTKVSSLSPKMNMVLYQKVGTSGKDQALVYKKSSKKIVVKPDTDVKNKIVQSSSVKTPKLVTKTTRWKYNNSFDKLMFGLAQKQSVYHRNNTIYVPKSWLVLTPKQVKALPTIMKKMSAQAQTSQAQQQMQAAGKSYVQQAVMAAMKKNPKMSADQQAAIGKKAAAEYKAKAQKQAMQKMMPMVQKELARIK